MKRIMAVYDLDLFYAKRFADVMNQKENIPVSYTHLDVYKRQQEGLKSAAKFCQA